MKIHTIGWAALCAGCAAENPTLLAVPIHLAPSATDVTLDSGVRIELNEATYTLADIRLEAPAKRASYTPSWLFGSTAHAHPGHDFAGDVAGELTGTWTVDLLGDELHLGDANCYSGDYATGHFALVPDPNLVLAGTATVGDTPRAFRFALAPDQDITGLPFIETIDADAPPARIRLSVDLAHSLSFVDWNTTDDDNDDVLTLNDGNLANTVLFGVVSTPSFSLLLENE